MMTPVPVRGLSTRNEQTKPRDCDIVGDMCKLMTIMEEPP